MLKQPDITIPESATEALALTVSLIERYDQAELEAEARCEDLDAANKESARARDEFNCHKTRPGVRPTPEAADARGALETARSRAQEAQHAVEDANSAATAYGNAAAQAGLAYIVRVLAANADSFVGMKPHHKRFLDAIEPFIGNLSRASRHSFEVYPACLNTGIIVYTAYPQCYASVKLTGSSSGIITEQDLKRAEGSLIAYRVEDVEASIEAAGAARGRVRDLTDGYRKFVEVHNAKLDAIAADLTIFPWNREFVADVRSCKKSRF